jgi:hypothetical protein
VSTWPDVAAQRDTLIEALREIASMCADEGVLSKATVAAIVAEALEEE